MMLLLLSHFSHVWLFATSWTAALQASLSITNSWSCSNSCPSSRWCHPTISSCHFLLLLPSIFPSIRSFPVSWLFTSGGQTTGASALASFLPKKSQGWSPSEWTGWISLQSKGLSRVFSSSIVQRINSSVLGLLYGPTLTRIHDYWKKP